MFLSAFCLGVALGLALSNPVPSLNSTETDVMLSVENVGDFLRARGGLKPSPELLEDPHFRDFLASVLRARMKHPESTTVDPLLQFAAYNCPSEEELKTSDFVLFCCPQAPGCHCPPQPTCDCSSATTSTTEAAPPMKTSPRPFIKSTTMHASSVNLSLTQTDWGSTPEFGSRCLVTVDSCRLIFEVCC
jgi:hypothetical protein